MKPFLLRPVRQSDLPQLQVLVQGLQHSMTTLPNDPDFLANKIHDSIRGFYPQIRKPGGEQYMFVLEETETGRVVGTSGLIARVGGFDPFYTYEINTEHLRHPPLGIDRRIQVLFLKMTHKGPSEICTLYLNRDQRGTGTGRFLSLARLLFIQAFPHRFDDTLIAELRGFIGPDGQSPFWQVVAKPFFEKDFYIADMLSGLGDKEFIRKLMPRHPIYVDLLPDHVREVIGRVHPQTEPAKSMLLDEGFVISSEIDIFDAGPVLTANWRDLRCVRECRQLPWTGVDGKDASPALADAWMIANGKLDFRAMVLPETRVRPDHIALSGKEADLLGVDPGDVLQATRLKRASSTA